MVAGRCQWLSLVQELLTGCEGWKRRGGIQCERNPISDQWEVLRNHRVHDVGEGSRSIRRGHSELIEDTLENLFRYDNKAFVGMKGIRTSISKYGKRVRRMYKKSNDQKATECISLIYPPRIDPNVAAAILGPICYFSERGAYDVGACARTGAQCAQTALSFNRYPYWPWSRHKLFGISPT